VTREEIDAMLAGNAFVAVDAPHAHRVVRCAQIRTFAGYSVIRCWPIGVCFLGGRVYLGRNGT
jgi:hypothetical protein